MNTLIKIIIAYLSIFLWGCNKDISKDSADLLEMLQSDYNLIPLDTSNTSQCLTEQVIFSYKNAQGKIIKNSAEEFFIEIEKQNKLQEQKLLYPCNLPKECQKDSLELYLDGNVGENLARNFYDTSGIFISVDGQQRIFLKNIWIKK
jgi:hypothetical protein